MSLALVALLLLKLQSIWPAKKSQQSTESSRTQQKSAAYNLRKNGLQDIQSGDFDNGISKLKKAREVFVSEKNDIEVTLTEQQIDFAEKEKVNQSNTPGPYVDNPEKIETRN